MTAAVLGASAIAFSAILVRLSEATPVTAAVFRCAYALPPLALLARLEARRFGPRDARARSITWIAGVLLAIDLVFWHHAIEAVGAGLATVLGNLQVVVVAVLAHFLLRERVTRSILVAILTALVGVVMISGVLEQGAYGENPSLGVLFGVLTSVSYAGFLLVLRRGAADLRGVAGPLFDATLSATVVAAAIGAVGGGLALEPSWPAHGWLIALALTSQVMGWLLISVSLPRLPAALTSVLLLVQPVGSVALGVVLLDEAPSALQLAGVALILSGVVLAARDRARPIVAPLAAPAEVPTQG